MPSDFAKDAPRPRLCHLAKWPDFDGYGFNLHAEKNKAGQFIGKVDADSPAELAGLKEGDRIIEVNNVNIGNENHKQVVERIKAIANETKLLVLDSEADDYYKSKKIVVKGNQSNVLLIKTPVSRNPESSESFAAKDDSSEGRKSTPDSEILDDRASRSSRTSSMSNGADNTSQTGSRLSTPPADRKEQTNAVTPDSHSPSPTTLTPPRTPTNGTSNGASNGKGLNLNMSASEMRALIAQRKKYDPKKENLDVRKKYNIIQEM